MKRIAKFEKVSRKQFEKSTPIGEYDDIKLPVRATKGSAGYDFFAPFDFKIPVSPNSIKIPTGIRCKMEEGYLLSLYPRSSLGFKYKVRLDNTVGIVDQDYYDSDNEGHIMIKLSAESGTEIIVKKGEAFAQGIFTEFFITEDDEVTATRNGGFGSTNK